MIARSQNEARSRGSTPDDDRVERPASTRVGGITRVLLASGVLGPPFFVAVFLIEEATRPDYNAMRSMVSELSLSDQGWQQIGNFLVTGTLVLAFSVGLRRVIHTEKGSALGSYLIGLFGAALIAAGLFVTDPGLGYPPGAPVGLSVVTWHGQLHALAGYVAFFSVPFACFGFARHFAAARERGWARYSLVSGVLGLALIPAFGIAANHGGPAGLFQRLAIVVDWSWVAMLALHVMWASLGNPSGDRSQVASED